MNPNAATIRSIYDSFARGDVPTFLGVLAPDVKWTEAEGFPYAGTYTGPQAVLEGVLMKIGAEWDRFVVEPREYVSEGDTVVAIGMYRGRYRATGKSFDAPYVHVWKFKGGKVQTFEQHCDTVLVQRALR